MITAIMPKPSLMEKATFKEGDPYLENIKPRSIRKFLGTMSKPIDGSTGWVFEELTCHRINRGVNEIVAEYEDMIRDTSFASQRGDCELIPKDELELLRAYKWYCCSDISDELMLAIYRNRDKTKE